MRQAAEHGWVISAAMVIASSELIVATTTNAARTQQARQAVTRQWQEARDRGLEAHVREAVRTRPKDCTQVSRLSTGDAA